MVAYELIKKLEKLPYYNNLLKSGVVPISWVDYKVIYEFYQKEIIRLIRGGFSQSKAKRQAKTNASEEFNIGESTVYWIVKKMKS
ncbi:hypothetical protein [Aquimarina intermedia]|uniref:Uncharacterized protein n=1 Tax=Aquimarina intermedia TaxID=350814 RepID=A0A5S5BWS5_9FLAO|nr:hypothetical protein [Aquimarina intermedia]TYP71487.1 hypothetical protein BD809_10969 [Aquimarina intermedia]